MALVIAPVEPIDQWLAAFQEQRASAPGFFDSRPVVVDLAAMAGEGRDLTRFIESLEDEDLRIIGVEGYDAGWTNINAWGRPPLLGAAKLDTGVIVPGEAPPPSPTSLIIHQPVRSGQTIIHEHGDVTILGFVSSGAEIIAAGSIHVYGALRGRAIAGFNGRPDARIFCRKLDPELLAIDGIYKAAENLDPALRHKPAQAWLAADSLTVGPL